MTSHTAPSDRQLPLSSHNTGQVVHNLSVDQGIAALLGATVGVLGTVSASAISGWSSRQQIRTQATVDHAQWRRQARRDAYSAFLAPAHETRNALKRAARALIGDADVEEAQRQLQAAHDRLGEAHASWSALAVEGPDSVEQAANGVKTALHSMHTTLLAWCDSPEHPHNIKFVERHAVEVTLVSERISIFAAAARAALDEATLPVDTSNN
ncbi:hypothetical protein [Streptomyces ureilyticus]|uniref:Uncharacterized protein n=1 Tax=Streptomyces ureilyticus TaxID=1775131 RepID=A0ABX0E006_9ACTN|nr:hypothetical protein [Streptomyces ureilyticus]NGO46119.1 hypothetical protein [Streptomyces ureilyticus]